MPNWTKEQALAIDKDNSNIIVSAGAGSGKTAVLTARVIRKLKDGVDVNRLLVLTFTNEAASEMKDRIRKAIRKEESLKEQLDFIDSAYITTFDSFALSILKKYHYVLGVSRNISIIDNSIISIKKFEFIDEIFEQLYEKEDSNFLKLIGDFCIKDDKDIKSQVLKISSILDLKLDKEEYLNNYIDTFYNEDYVNQLISSYVKSIISLKNEIKSIYEEILILEDGKKALEYEACLLPLINAESYEEIKNNLNISLPRIAKNSKECKEEIKAIISKLSDMTMYDSVTDIYSVYMSTKSYVSAIVDIIKELDKKVSLYKKNNDSYEFVDVSKMAIDIVTKNSEIRDEIKYYYNEIMVDEYQDTNDLQEAFIGAIANNNVYMVGDIKQSIYRFRNANPFIFKNKYDNYSNGLDGYKIDLLKNFRSRSEVLSDINKIFDKIMDDFLGGADYRATHRMVFGNITYDENKDNSISNFLEIYNYDPKEYKEFSKEEKEAFIIAEDIKNKIDSKYNVLDKETGVLRPVTYSDFCIIMDRGTSFDLYKKIFEYLNIPLAIYRDEILGSANDILLIKNIIKFIIKIKLGEFDQEFKYMFTSIARSYLFEMDDNDIFNLFVNNGFKDTDIYSISRCIADSLDNITSSKLITLIIDEFKFYENIIKYRGSGSMMVRVLYLKKIVKNLESLGYSPYELSSYFDDMIDNGLDIKYKVNTKSSNSVKIMNIHKSKGLEFPVCYYSGLYKTFNIRDFNERFMFDNKYGIITPYYKDGIGVMFTKNLAKDEYIKEEISEKIRLFYVALTRAKEKMILIAPLDEDIYNKEDVVNEKTRLLYRSFLDIINTVKDEFDGYVTKFNELDFLTKDYNTIKNVDLSNLGNGFLPYEVRDVDINFEEVSQSKFSKVNNTLKTSDEINNMKMGTYIHYLFEVTDFKNPNYEVLGEYGDMIKKFLSHDLFKDVDKAEIFKEYEFIYDNGLEERHGIIDLMICYSDHIDIIDYKLSNIDDDAYSKQLNGYREYITLKTGLDVKCYIYSINKDILKEII